MCGTGKSMTEASITNGSQNRSRKKIELKKYLLLTSCESKVTLEYV